MAIFSDFSTKNLKKWVFFNKKRKKMAKIFGNIGYFSYIYYVIVKKI